MKIMFIFVALLTTNSLPKSDAILDKIKKNVIVHNFCLPFTDVKIEGEIEQKEKELLALYEKRNAKVSIYLPSTHPVVQNSLLNYNRFVEFSAFSTRSERQTQTREVFYITKIENADVSVVFDDKMKYITDYAAEEKYIRLECTYISGKSLLKLSGLDAEDIGNPVKK